MIQKEKRRAPVGSGNAARDNQSGYSADYTELGHQIQESFRHIHDLGPRVTAEFFAELVVGDADRLADATMLLDRYGRLTVDQVEMTGGGHA
jgi:hypothetical protein